MAGKENTMKTILHKCPSCAKPHALVWYQRKDGKQQLGVICDATLVLRHRKGEVSTAEHTSFVEVLLTMEQTAALPPLKDIPVILTPSARKAAALKGQGQLAMMLVKDGETVPERQVELPRGRNNNQKIAELKLSIDQHLQAAAELDTQIASLERKRQGIKAKA
jgi:uncharacterized protein YbaR (Trm112 family)